MNGTPTWVKQPSLLLTMLTFLGAAISLTLPNLPTGAKKCRLNDY